MKKIILYTQFLLIAFTTLSSFAQKENIKGYKIEGDEIVFTFNKNDYEKISSDNNHSQRDFDDLDIETVVVSGTFNDWSKDQWRMTKIDDNTYELRKKLADFTDEFSWEFKFVVNNKYWAEPSRNYSNIAVATKHGEYLDVYNLQLFTAHPDKNGNVSFRLPGHYNAKKVIVTGSFNKWNEKHFRMNKTDKGWELTLKLSPNEYQYRFIVDGKWMEDPTNPDKVPNEFGEYNSRINIKKQITFYLLGYQNAKNVILAGSFNDWDEQHCNMKLSEKGIWIYTIPLSAGKHHYKFIVDGNWLLDPNNSIKEDDGHGNVNSVFMVK